MYKKIIALIIVLSLTFTSCARVNIDLRSSNDKEFLMNSPQKAFTIVKHIEEDFTASFVIFELVPINHPEIVEFLEQELKSSKGDAIVNIKIKTEMSLIDGAIPFLIGQVAAIATGSPYAALLSVLYGQRSIHIEGDIIKYK